MSIVPDPAMKRRQMSAALTKAKLHYISIELLGDLIPGKIYSSIYGTIYYICITHFLSEYSPTSALTHYQ